jgi:hypothetical protein
VTTKEERMKRTAYHEAGHAVAFYMLRIWWVNVSILPMDEFKGSVTHPRSIYKNFDPGIDGNDPKCQRRV